MGEGSPVRPQQHIHRQTQIKEEKKTEDENDSAESQNTVTQSNDLQNLFTPTITNWPKYLMAKSTNENTPLTKLNPFKLAKGINLSLIHI